MSSRTDGIFVFHSQFRIDAPPRRVFEVLHDVERWPTWWPQVRSVRPIDDISGFVDIRSLLPITLRLKLIAEVDDASTGTLRAGLGGDLTGWTQFVVRAEDGATSLIYDQEATVTRPGFSHVASLGRPVLVLNHRLMMRRGMAGLQRRSRSTH